MNLNRISIGGGLALVAVGLLANAAASLVGTPDRIAHADGMKRADKRQQQEPVADVVVPRQDERGVETMAMGAACVATGVPELWFGAVRDLPQCLLDGSGFEGPLSFGPPRQQDVNGDGRPEFFVFSGSAIITSSGEWMDDALVTNRRAFFDGEGVVFENVSVLPRDWLATWILANTNWTSASIDWNFSGWFDLDQDADLDLILLLSGNQGPLRLIWLENTGFEKQQFAAGDINQDGNVDGVDISILLSDWSY